nr:CASP-like protein 4A1 [Penaeus vannamei]
MLFASVYQSAGTPTVSHRPIPAAEASRAREGSPPHDGYPGINPQDPSKLTAPLLGDVPGEHGLSSVKVTAGSEPTPRARPPSSWFLCVVTPHHRHLHRPGPVRSRGHGKAAPPTAPAARTHQSLPSTLSRREPQEAGACLAPARQGPTLPSAAPHVPPPAPRPTAGAQETEESHSRPARGARPTDSIGSAPAPAKAPAVLGLPDVQSSRRGARPHHGEANAWPPLQSFRIECPLSEATKLQPRAARARILAAA